MISKQGFMNLQTNIWGTQKIFGKVDVQKLDVQLFDMKAGE